MPCVVQEMAHGPRMPWCGRWEMEPNPCPACQACARVWGAGLPLPKGRIFPSYLYKDLLWAPEAFRACGIVRGFFPNLQQKCRRQACPTSTQMETQKHCGSYFCPCVAMDMDTDVTCLKTKVSVHNSSVPREKRKIDLSRSLDLRLLLNSFWLEFIPHGLGGGMWEDSAVPNVAPGSTGRREPSSPSTGS